MDETTEVRSMATTTARRSVTVSGDWHWTAEGWSAEEQTDVEMFSVAFAAQIDDRETWSGGVCPHVTRAVAEAIVREQMALIGDDMETDRLAWDGDVIVLTHGAYADWVERIGPADDGLYPVSFGWTWSEVADDEKIGDLYA